MDQDRVRAPRGARARNALSARVWSRYAREVSSRYTVYTWDLPGYGESSKHPQHPVNFGVHAEAFSALADHWDLDGVPHVVAHDFGGGVALRAHLVEKVPYASLLLVDAVGVPPSGSPFFRFVASHSEVLAQLPPDIHESVVRAYIQGASHQGLQTEDLDDLVAPWTGESGQPAFYRQIAGYDESFLAENERRIGNLQLPVRVLWGSNDDWLSVQAGRRLHGLIDGAQWRLIEGAGHLIQYDAPVDLSHEITTWLTSHTS